jgi:ectoine hydroxylase-related dioxygenase (phytanoyl-CoA dioxygenase family)
VSFWTPLDPVPAATALQCVAGSHRWSSVGFLPQRFDGSPLYANDDFEAIPDIEAEREHLRILSWDMQPGDAVAFDFRTLHGAPANATGTQRRVFSARFVGDDARYVRRTGPTSPPFPGVTLEDGAPLEGTDFPKVYPAA